MDSPVMNAFTCLILSVVYLLVSRSMVHSGLASMTDNRLVAKEQYI